MRNKVLGTIFIAIVCIGIIVFIFSLENFESGSNDVYEVHRKCVSSEYIEGIDVSYYQKDIDWQTVKNHDITFGFARVSDGITKIDPKFTQNWVGMKDVEIIRGAYQFFRPNQDPLEQAQLFVTIVEGAGGFEDSDLPSVIDVEVTGNIPNYEIIDNMIIWLNFMEEYTQKKPIIYAGPYFWELNNLGDEFKDYPLWVAHYTREGECPLIPDPWSDWTFWQYTGSGEVKGVETIVDINIFDGTYNDLLTFIDNCKTVHAEPSIEPEDDVKDATPDIEDSTYEDVNTKEDVKIKDAGVDCNCEGDDKTGCECGIANISEGDIRYLIITIIGGFFLLRARSKR